MRYTSLRDVVEETLKRYEGVTELSKDFRGEEGKITCVYDHEANGVGCAIGCHYSKEEAKRLQEVAGIHTVLVGRHPALREILRKKFDLLLITLDELRDLQKTHDYALNVEEFRDRLRHYLGTGVFSKYYTKVQ